LAISAVQAGRGGRTDRILLTPGMGEIPHGSRQDEQCGRDDGPVEMDCPSASSPESQGQ
jgi:hypothetical protein